MGRCVTVGFERKKMRRYLALLLAALLLLVSCGKTEEADQGGYQIYYVNLNACVKVQISPILLVGGHCSVQFGIRASFPGTMILMFLCCVKIMSDLSKHISAHS